jgi:hypothetical protein
MLLPALTGSGESVIVRARSAPVACRVARRVKAADGPASEAVATGTECLMRCAFTIGTNNNAVASVIKTELTIIESFE